MNGLGQAVGNQIGSELGEVAKSIGGQMKGQDANTNKASEIRKVGDGGTVRQEKGQATGKQQSGDYGFKTSFKQQLGTLSGLGNQGTVQQRLNEVRRNLEQEMGMENRKKQKAEVEEKKVEEQKEVQKKQVEEKKKKDRLTKAERIKRMLGMGQGEKSGAGGY